MTRMYRPARVGFGVVLPLAAGLFAVVTACTGSGPGPEVVAKADIGSFSRAELDNFILCLPEEIQQPAEGEELTTWRRKHLERMIFEEALMAEAENAGIARSTEVDEARRQIRTRVLAAAFEQNFITPQSVVGEEDLRTFYEAHPEDFGHPEQIRLRHIFRRVERDTQPENRRRAQAEMEGLLRRIGTGAHFGELAREHSDSQTARLDGLIGRLSRGSFDPSVEDVVWALEEGETSEVVSTAVGFHIFKVENRIPPFTMPFEEARVRLRKRLEAEAHAQATEETFRHLLSKYAAVFRPELLQDGQTIAGETVLFRLNERTIISADVDRHLQTLSFAEHRYHPPSEWLTTMARLEIFALEAEETGLSERPEIAQHIDDDMRKATVQMMIHRRYRSHLEDLGESGVLEEYFTDNWQRFQTPKLVNLRLLFVRIDDFDPPYAGHELLQKIRSDVIAGRRDLAEAAKALSKDKSAADGGLSGWIRLNGFGEWAGPRALRSIPDLQVGEISEPLLVERYDDSSLTYDRKGFVLVRMEGIQEPDLPPYEELMSIVADRYLQTNGGHVEAQVRNDVLEEIHAKILEDRL